MGKHYRPRGRTSFQPCFSSSGKDLPNPHTKRSHPSSSQPAKRSLSTLFFTLREFPIIFGWADGRCQGNKEKGQHKITGCQEEVIAGDGSAFTPKNPNPSQFWSSPTRVSPQIMTGTWHRATEIAPLSFQTIGVSGEKSNASFWRCFPKTSNDTSLEMTKEP